MKHLHETRQPDFLAALLDGGYEVHAPRRRGENAVLTRIDRASTGAGWAWNAFRLPASFKPLYFQTGKVLSRWSAAGPMAAAPPPRRAILGVKGCDLKALGVLDRVFRDHTYREPMYCAAREENLVVAGDCTAAGASCFCTMLGDHPWPDALHDLSLSPTANGFLVETGSAKGEAWLAAHADLFQEAPAGAVAARDERRQEVEREVRDQNRAYETRDPFALSVEKNVKTRIWGKLAATCVECNACNHVCPTCHCFLLHDVATEDGAERISLWDSCFHAGYARMAGGGTPRLQLVERFKNHYVHKFVSFPKNWGITACSGCGRCIDACMGRIDKRRCLHRLETEWIPSEVVQEM